MQHKSRFLSLVLGIAVMLILYGPAMSQETTRYVSTDTTKSIFDEEIILEELVIIGSRAKPRSVVESAVPVDVVTSAEIVKQGEADLQNLVRTVVPSFNVNTQPISDASTLVRPANLRGLAPDHTLVLINGKRRHRSSLVVWHGNGVSDGAQGADISVIPAIALRQVEVLRDGASAQYGSDAIAGVMSFQLKDHYEGGSVEIKPGIYQAGDGFKYSVAGNIGLGSENVWANLSLEYGNADDTDRSAQRNDAKALRDAGNTDVADPAQIWGSPIIRNDLKFLANYGGNLSENTRFYGYANYASKEVEGGFFFRNPNTRGGVFSTDGGKTLLVGKLNPNAPDPPVVNIIDDVADPNALQQVLSNKNDYFTFRELFPGGFTPRFGGTTADYALLAGVKGTKFDPIWTWDLSAYYGRHEADFVIKNTVNASLGRETPTEFDPGAYIQQDLNVNLDFTFPVSEQLFLAAGLEYRNEKYEVVQGQPESYQIGPLAPQGFSAASNGFSGFSDIAAGNWSRSNYAAYGDAEFTPSDNWMLGLALRYENFSDFGSTLNYKVASNYSATEGVKLRGSFSSCFRAPTPGQQNSFNVSTLFDPALNDLVNRGTIPSTHAAAKLVGGQPLDPEKSYNYTAGFIVGNTNTSLTVDYFQIDLKDRLGISKNYSLTDAQRDQLVASGITSARNIQTFRFFINDFETRTRGIDIVFVTPAGNGDFSFIYNLTDTKVTKNTETLSDTRIRQLEEALPQSRANATLTQSLKDTWDVLIRMSYYTSWWDRDNDQTYPSVWPLVDIETNIALNENMQITLGSRNVLNTFPEENKNKGSVGEKYSEYTPFGFNGAFWYSKVSYDF